MPLSVIPLKNSLVVFGLKVSLFTSNYDSLGLYSSSSRDVSCANLKYFLTTIEARGKLTGYRDGETEEGKHKTKITD